MNTEDHETILPAKNRFETVLRLAALRSQKSPFGLNSLRRGRSASPRTVRAPGAHPIRRRDHFLRFLAGEQPKLRQMRFHFALQNRFKILMTG
jgi:hypothetical protein